ncbi:hypothetical protein AOQ84DRAFT_226472 [Glonium stellatum]|uniref:Major facilitator superfamily (MFS) profile domain-containing protein n=1 Tax=Glonium stellatum TaxID=574774 RepID=A0A8E2JNQ7_9PEZI|nr:hypothetical protein AOQ84DRAFT_226472 [Glonium stellatum]
MEAQEIETRETEPQEIEPQRVDSQDSVKLKQNPIEHMDPQMLWNSLKVLYNKFENKDSITFEELWVGAMLAKKYGDHNLGPDGSDAAIPDLRISDEEPPRVGPDFEPLNRREKRAIRVQHSLAFWEEPKGLLVTLMTCCVAALTQGWDQATNGNLGWPVSFGLAINAHGTGTDVWKFGLVNAIPWFSAAVLGPLFVDPVCYAKVFGRRGAIFIAAMFSFASTISGSRAQSWHGYLVSRIFLGIGIGAKASIVPILESEILPPAKRGRLLVSWQVFTAAGIFAGGVATYIFRDNWRNQVLSGAIPAFLLLVLTFLCCESPRWLVVQGKYAEAFETLIRLRKERILAAEELCYIYFQIQTAFRNQASPLLPLTLISGPLLTPNSILAFLASVFFSTASLRTQRVDPRNPEAIDKTNVYDSLCLTIGFGAANTVFSAIAYFLVEPVDRPVNESDSSNPNTTRGNVQTWISGRRSLLLLSLGGGTLMLLILTFLLDLKKENPAKLPVIVVFIMLFTLFYSPGAGCIPFLYSAEVWQNEAREIGMSWAVFWNFLGELSLLARQNRVLSESFLGAGFLALLVPQGFEWGHSKLFGVFTGLSFLSILLVWLFVPATEPALSLEEMSEKFQESLIDHGKDRVKALDYCGRKIEET